MNELILAVIGSGALSACISGLFNVYNNSRKRKDGIEEGISFVLLFLITQNGKHLIDKGSITLEERRLFNEAYAAYKKLGGNGFADDLKGIIEEIELEA